MFLPSHLYTGSGSGSDQKCTGSDRHRLQSTVWSDQDPANPNMKHEREHNENLLHRILVQIAITIPVAIRGTIKKATAARQIAVRGWRWPTIRIARSTTEAADSGEEPVGYKYVQRFAQRF